MSMLKLFQDETFKYNKYFFLKQDVYSPPNSSLDNKYNLMIDIIMWITDNKLYDVNVKDVSRKYNVPTKHIDEIFIRNYKCTMDAWLKEERLLVVRELLYDGVDTFENIVLIINCKQEKTKKEFKSRFGVIPEKIYKFNSYV